MDIREEHLQVLSFEQAGSHILGEEKQIQVPAQYHMDFLFPSRSIESWLNIIRISYS
jgi:hypothetical protein